jgi:hypothetical protein
MRRLHDADEPAQILDDGNGWPALILDDPQVNHPFDREATLAWWKTALSGRTETDFVKILGPTVHKESL